MKLARNLLPCAILSRHTSRHRMSEAFTFIGLAAFSAVEYLVIAIISWPIAFLALAGVLYVLKRNGNRVCCDTTRDLCRNTRDVIVRAVKLAIDIGMLCAY